jgi:hypothetical protein
MLDLIRCKTKRRPAEKRDAMPRLYFAKRHDRYLDAVVLFAMFTT